MCVTVYSNNYNTTDFIILLCVGVSKPAPESSATSPATPTVANDEIKAEIEADVAVVTNLKELEASFSHMLVQVKRLLINSKCDLSDALLILSLVLKNLSDVTTLTN